MGLFDYLISFNYTYLRQKMFRRDVEASTFIGKKFPLPVLNSLKSLKGFKENYPLSFYRSSQEKSELINAINELEKKENTIAHADKICSNIYDIFCTGEISLGEEINWQKDYKSGYEWQTELVWRTDYFNSPKGADIKYPWQITRMNQLLVLGKAYMVTSDDKYVDKYISLIKNFIVSNKFCFGVNWVDSSEVSIRLINLAYSLSFFLDSEKIDENFIQSFNDLLIHHSIFIENNLNFSNVRDSKYLLNLLALLTAGLIYNNDFYGKKLVRFAHSGLEYEIRMQFYDDGVSREQSLPLHSVVVECLYLAKLILIKAGSGFTKEYDEILMKALSVQSCYLRDDLTVPQIGDAITGRILPLNYNYNDDYAYPLAAGMMLFEFNSPLKKIKPGAELVLLFGSDAVQKYDALFNNAVKTASSAYKTGGHYILRNENVHLFIEAGEIGNYGKGAPGHNDTFTFELLYKAKKFIVDPGTYSIYADKELRNKLRTVKYHNTAYVDDTLLSEPDGLFKIKEDLTKPILLEWKQDNNSDILSVQHYAYTKLADPVICRRSFRFDKINNKIKITDEFIGGAEHKVVINFHLHPELIINTISDGNFILKYENVKMSLNIITEALNKSVSINDSVYSEKYGCIQNSKKITLVFKEKLPSVIETEIILM